MPRGNGTTLARSGRRLSPALKEVHALPQIFRPRSNLLFRGALLAVAVVGAGALGAAWVLRDSTYDTQVGVAPTQPLPFSHKHHVGGLGLDCRYCHASVEKAASAGMPATHTCMSCHSQIWNGSPLLAPLRDSYREGRRIEWKRVNRLPDHVYFNHSIHIKREVSCATCHGNVERMPLTWKERPFTMKDCLQCHRDPTPYVAASEKYNLTRCYTCHR